MPIVSVRECIIPKASEHDNFRTVILVDRTINCEVYAKFPAKYDDPFSQEGVDQLFDSAMLTLSSSTETLFDETSLPILKHIGRWSVTIVERSLNGRINVRDGHAKPADSYMGLGG